MGIFKRRKDDEAFKIQLEREAIDKMKHHTDTDFTLPVSLEGGDSVWNISGKAKAPHTITADELMGSVTKASNQNVPSKTIVDNISMSQSEFDETPSNFLYKRMTEARQQSLDAVLEAKEQQVAQREPENIKETVLPKVENKQNFEAINKNSNADEKLDIDALIRSLNELANKENSFEEKEKSTIDSIIEPAVTSKSSEVIEKEVLASTLAKDAILNTPPSSNSFDIPPAIDPVKAKLTEQRRTSLLARCNAFLEDEEFGTAKMDTEKYKLESVESILKDFEEKASQRAMKTFNTNKQQSNPATSSPTTTINLDSITPKSEPVLDKTTVFSPVNDDNSIAEPENKDLDLTKNDNTTPVKHYFTVPVQPKNKEVTEPKDTNLDATRVMSDVEIEKINLSSKQKADKTSIFDALNLPKPEEKLASDVFERKENYVQNANLETEKIELDDYNSVDDRARVLGQLVSKRRAASVKSVLNILLLFPAVLLLTPITSSLNAINPIVPFICELTISILALLINFEAVKSVISLFKNNANPKAASGIALLGVLLFSIIQLLDKNEFISISSLTLISLLFNTVSDRNHFNIAISNFDIIANSNYKKAVAIIKNKTATETIVGNSIEGGSLICCGADTINVKNFLKYTYCNNPVAKKIKRVSIFGVVLSVIILILALLFTEKEISSAILYFCIALCVTAAPSTLLTSRLPFKIAKSRLKLYDSMLTGYRAANELDLCNGVAISCNDLFPEGSIRLVDMKLLSPNPIDQSMIDAAALADAMGSPIAGIFKQVSTESSYTQKPIKVDSFAYENKMGISGWVDDRRVFVGNRVLMEAHGFENLPPIELDKKIMRKGYFPVYLVSDNVPCALLIIKYSPDEEIAYELRRLCNTGTTVLIDNCDPNISEEMICDYFGLFSESVYVMSKQGSAAFENISNAHKDISAGAAYKGNICGLFATLTASINIKRSIFSMTLLYIIFVVLGLFALAVLIFTPILSYVNTIFAIAFQLVTTLLISLPPLIKRP